MDGAKIAVFPLLQVMQTNNKWFADSSLYLTNKYESQPLSSCQQEWQ